MKQITFNKDQVIFRENDFATVMYDIISGKVGIFTGYQTDQEKKKDLDRNDRNDRMPVKAEIQSGNG